MTKRKDERRELLKEDEFLSLMERAIQYAKGHKQNVMFGVIGFFVLIAVAIGGYEWSKVNEDKAAATLFEVEQMMQSAVDDPQAEHKFDSEQAKNEALLAKLNELIARESGIVAEQANLHKIAVLVNLGRDDETLAVYETLAKNKSAVGLWALIGLGDYYVGHDQSDQALNYYNQVLARKDGKELYEDLVNFKMAECLSKKGDKPTAREKLESIVAKYQDAEEKAPIFQKAQTMLDEINQEETTGAS